MDRRAGVTTVGRMMALVALGWGVPATGAATSGTGAAGQAPREIAIRAQQFVFTPSEIEVMEGETVRLTIEAVDVPHGVAIPDLGLRAVARPGQAPAVLEFTAGTPGRYRFACAVFCGNGHGGMTGVLTVVPAGGAPVASGPDRVDDLAVDVVEPDFSLITQPTTLRLPHNAFAFRLTHRFSRPLDGGPAHGNLLEDFFGFDSPAFIGLELRYGLAPGAQVGIYRNNNRNIQVFGKYNLLWSRADHGVGLDAFVSVEGTDNLRDEHSPAVGVVVSKRLGERAAVYAQPLWVGNANKPLFHPEPGFSSDDDHAMLVGLGARVRVLDSVSVAGEYVPRVAGFDNGDDHISVAIEKRVGGHLFQLNFSNGLGSSPAQVAGGGNHDDWYIGFNITRKFY